MGVVARRAGSYSVLFHTLASLVNSRAVGARPAGDITTNQGSNLTDNNTATTAIADPTGRRPFTIHIAISLVIVALDQLTKWAILAWVPLYDKIVISSFINITHQQNRGAAFSFLADAAGWQRWFFTVLAIVVSTAIVVWLWRIRKDRLLVLSSGLALVLGGAVGNVIDRIRFGHVVDYIQVLIAGWPFPSFNVADSAITVGAALLIIDALFISGRTKPVAEEGSPSGN
jgi:signal peptidase II